MHCARRLWTLILAALCSLWGCTGSACGGPSQSPPHAQAPSGPAPFTDTGLPRPAFRLAVVTDIKGYLEPCGCTSRPLGGIDRLAHELASVRADGVETLFVSAGDTFFDGKAHAPAAQAQENWKAETLVDIFNTLGLVATSIGPLDLSQGPEVIRNLASRAHFPLLWNGTDDGEQPRSLIREVNGLKIGFVGVVETDTPTEHDARAVAIERAASVRSLGAQIVIGLVRGSRRFSRRIADSERAFDFVVQGGIDEAAASPPTTVEGAAVLHASRHGMGLVLVDVFARPGARATSWTDVSAWTRNVERTRVSAAMTDLSSRIAQWRRENRPAADIAAQEERLAQMRQQLDGLAQRPSMDRNAFAARYIELDREHASDANVKAMIDAYSRRVNEHNRVALAHLVPEPAPAGQPHYVGVAACESCHAPAVRWWRDTLHGHAYSTLQNLNKEFNLSCVGCHVTGYEQPGGSTVTHNQGLTDVQCEQCHGPGSAHVANPVGAPMANRRTVPEAVCVHCHQPEHSDQFEYQRYVRMMRAPGHGAPLASAEEHTRERLAAAWLGR